MKNNCSHLWQQGWLNAALECPSPNYTCRPETPISLVVLHNISLPPFEYHTPYITALFQNHLTECPQTPFTDAIHHLKVSSHFLIRRDGQLCQFVSCDDMAFHAGVSVFENRSACNEFSIGIELEGCDYEPFEEAQYISLLPLLTQLCQHYPIEAICGHSDIAPGRKTDPGYFFDWSRLSECSLPVSR